jgi:diguanylate cyclase (GGDEF)-like protein
MNVTEFLSKRSKRVLVPLGLVLFLIVWIGVHITERELEIEIFYIIPVAYFSWFLSRPAGIAAALVRTGLLLIENHPTSEYDLHRSITYWKDLLWFALFVFIVLIVSELKLLYIREKERSLTNHLTKIANRRAFFEYLTAEKNRARRYAFPMTVAYVDLDNFKNINDRLGHATGDRVLMRVAKVVRENIRASDFVARMGGDEFAVLLPQTNMQAAEVVLAKMQQALDNAMRDEHWEVSFSIGSVTFCPPPDSVEEIISQADTVMYSVKARGRGGLKQKEMAA